MNKLVLILLFIILQTSLAQWQPCKNGIQTNEISCYNTEVDNTNTGKLGELIMATGNDDYWFINNNRLSNLRVRSLAMNENNISSGTEYERVFISANDGVEWKDMGQKNSASNTFMAIIGNNIFLGGEGVYLSTDYGNNWTTKNSGLIYLNEPGLIIYGDYIFAGTKNKGVYRAKLSDLGIIDVKDTYRGIEFTIYPNPASNDFNLKFNSPNETSFQIYILDNLGKEVFSRTEKAGQGTNEKIINCEKLASGNYFVKININEIVQTLPLLIIK
ncbi:MAG: T9SS type A sorting domain-containing protein [Ignavibacteriae bacterium]|nr:T9SS type A sorting domain-containing protein [Ignavibacteriota bacterium]